MNSSYMETVYCMKCNRRGCFTQSEEDLSDWICKCGFTMCVEQPKENETEGGPGSLLESINELGKLLGKPPLRIKL